MRCRVIVVSDTVLAAISGSSNEQNTSIPRTSNRIEQGLRWPATAPTVVQYACSLAYCEVDALDHVPIPAAICTWQELAGHQFHIPCDSDMSIDVVRSSPDRSGNMGSVPSVIHRIA